MYAHETVIGQLFQQTFHAQMYNKRSGRAGIVDFEVFCHTFYVQDVIGLDAYLLVVCLEQQFTFSFLNIIYSAVKLFNLILMLLVLGFKVNIQPFIL